MIVRRRVGILSLLALTGALLVAFTSPASASPGGCIDQVPALQKAPMLAADTNPDGGPVLETTLDDGSSIPVVMVHGWTGTSIHDDSRTGNFSQVVNLTDLRGQAVNLNRSLIGVIQDAGGATVYTFDYHDVSSRWVTDDAIGRQLANALSCLASAHGHPAMVVAHSMGGLAMREALSLIEQDGTHGPVEANVSDVITYGTPNTGSWLASVIGAANQAARYSAAFPGVAGPVITAVRSLVTLCGTATTKSMTDAGLCSRLKPQLASATSQAARALAIGSPQMRALPQWPAPVRVQAMFGSADVEVVKIGWFGATVAAGSVNLGDFVVGAESARGGAQMNQAAECSYTLDWRTATADNLLEAAQLKSAGETKDNLIFAAGGSPCYHGNLMRDIEFSNTVLATIAELVDAQNAATTAPASDRWLITAQGVGPVLIGAPVDDIDPYLEGRVFCLGADWGIDPQSPSGSGLVEGIDVQGRPGIDTPITKSGITIGSPVSDLDALGATSQPWEKNTSTLVYSWSEDGASLSALVDDRTVTSLGVGSFFRYLDC